MNKEFFKQQSKELFRKQSELQNQINELRKEYHHLRDEYIEQNLPCKEGDKAKTNRGKIGIVTGFKVDAQDNVIPVLSKIKKDGTASQRELYMWSNETIECYMPNNEQSAQVSDTTKDDNSNTAK